MVATTSKAITAEGVRLDVKGREPIGERLRHLKAIAPDGSLMGVKAISPHGLFYDVKKGLKFNADEQEQLLDGVAVRAHVKALPQVD